MKWKQPLTGEQQTLVEENLHLVRWTVREYIHVREEIEGLGFEDLCQEGAIALCHAAAAYQTGSVRFKTYAVTVIRNYLLDHCRKVMARQRNMPTLPLDAPLDEDKPPSQIPLAPDDAEEWISELYVSRILTHTGGGQFQCNGKRSIAYKFLPLTRPAHRQQASSPSLATMLVASPIFYVGIYWELLMKLSSWAITWTLLI